MRSPLALALLVVALSSASAACSGGPPPPAMAKAADSGADEKEIARVLDDWHEAAARAEEARYFGHFAPGAVFLGTDASERWTLDAFRTWAHPKFASGKAWTMKSRRRSVMVARSGDFAWFDEDLDTPNLGPARGTGVLTGIPPFSQRSIVLDEVSSMTLKASWVKFIAVRKLRTSYCSNVCSSVDMGCALLPL